MAWRKINRYAFIWSQSSNRFSVDLWMTPPISRDPRLPDRRYEVAADEFVALCTMLRGDRDGQLFCDPETNQVSTGVDQL